MARKSERGKPPARKGAAKPRAKSGARVAKPAPRKAAAPTPPPAPKFKLRGKVLEHEPLARYTTWRIGGPARYLVQPADADDVQKALQFAREHGMPWLALGLGSNVLIKDAGFPGVVIRLGKGLDRLEMKGATAIVGAGLPTPLLARRTAEAGFAGVERFIGIPGTVGGGVYMNAGCHGAEFAEVVTEVTVMDGAGRVKTLGRRQISYKYRSSNLDGVVLEAKLALAEEPPAKLKEIQARLLRWRKAGTPFDQPCAGSTFKNPSGSTKTAGMLIDEAGLKGYRVGQIQISPMHANYIVNMGEGTAADVLKLIEHVRKTVAKKTGIDLELEIKVIGA
jgi:UDP-N-acetylmuramate dehydrogenase